MQKLFEKIGSDQNGQLDVLVNNAYAAVNFISDNVGKSFWESPPSLAWDITNNVGLRNHYICTVHAARWVCSNIFQICREDLLPNSPSVSSG